MVRRGFEADEVDEGGRDGGGEGLCSGATVGGRRRGSVQGYKR